MPVKELKLKSWKELQGFAKRGWLYRGQNDVGWPLTSTLERCCKREGIDGNDRNAFEKRLFRQFRRAYHQYSTHVPQVADELEWLSLMQHHGTPTRLVDFTYSVYIAAYFALDKADDDCVIWAVDGRWALNESIRILKASGKKKAQRLKELYEEKHAKVFSKYFMQGQEVPCVCPQNPFRLNERLQIQRGVFLVPTSIAMSFRANLRSMLGYKKKKNVFKLIIPGDMRKKALRHLFEMNITHTSLFPGLDGYAQSLGIYHPEFHRKPWSA